MSVKKYILRARAGGEIFRSFKSNVISPLRVLYGSKIKIPKVGATPTDYLGIRPRVGGRALSTGTAFAPGASHKGVVFPEAMCRGLQSRRSYERVMMRVQRCLNANRRLLSVRRKPTSRFPCQRFPRYWTPRWRRTRGGIRRPPWHWQRGRTNGANRQITYPFWPQNTLIETDENRRFCLRLRPLHRRLRAVTRSEPNGFS